MCIRDRSEECTTIEDNIKRHQQVLGELQSDIRLAAVSYTHLDERQNLNKDVNGVIIAFGDLGLWLSLIHI